MKKQRLGHSHLQVSELALGCMSLGTDEKVAHAIIETALEEGINYFDTADLYDFGVNERLVGQALTSVREEVIIATKVGNRWQEGKDGWTWDPSKAYIKEAVKGSLQRLQLDYIDLYQLHGGTIDDPIEETIEAFEELKKEGFIRAYGISSIRPNVIREFVKHSAIDSIMMQYSLLDRRSEEAVLPLLREHGVSVVARGPVAKGLLSDHWREKIKDQGYLDYSAHELKELLEKLEQLTTNEHSLNGLALRYLLHHESVASVVTGASSAQQLKENVRAVKEASLSTQEYKALQTLTKAAHYNQHR
ncbi:aldo/keto reductase [Bacillus sp. FJAT-42315]|uniref:aldo/keto reductase n=1 Tax=Bacillus sp. FJAT-42315 TaxID=2014077 RepID=UPI000C2316CC|nr:aldo/keto reductase [Bacillus sp. FJAT-42315]